MNLYPVNPGIPPAPPAPSDSVSGVGSSQRFSEFVASGIEQVDRSLASGERAIEKLHSGEAQNLHDVMIAVEQADLSLRMFVQIRNKALQAYEEIMRMQI
jgi:flagellar hook-basal body complex protein FliE